MALLQFIGINLNNRSGNVLKMSSALVHSKGFTEKVLGEIESTRKKKDMPIQLEKNPYEKEKPKCILCQYDIDPDYKNVRLLSQFVSKFTGRIYGRHITGLCEHKHNRMLEEIKKAQYSGLMGCYVRNPNYVNDPEIVDINRPLRII